MTTKILTLLSLPVLAGCVSTHDGNHATTSIQHNQQMARSTVDQLLRLYPPARTRLNLRHPATDAYGRSLLQGLREKGYALSEWSEQNTFLATPKPCSGLEFSYTVAALTSTSLYQVTVRTGPQSLSRVFAVGPHHKMWPKGPWVHQDSPK